MTEAAMRGENGSGAARFWEDIYRGRSERPWDGGANPVLIEVAGPLPAGTALDLGSGEGSDALWLARRGWRVTAVDVATTALDRLTARAAAAGLGERITAERHDLTESFPAGAFDLVSSQYLQSPLEFPRERVLQRAAVAVAPGGLLLIVDHASTPPWSWHQHSDRRFPTPEETLATVDLRPGEWETERLGAPARPANGPNGEVATVVDNVIAVRRVR